MKVFQLKPGILANTIFSSAAFFLLVILVTSFTTKPANPDAILGVWKTGEGTAMVRIYKNGEKYQGNCLVKRAQ